MATAYPDIAVFEAIARQDASLRWFATADSAQHNALPEALAQPGHEVRCLLGASQGSPVAQHAPHLVELSSPLDGGSAWHWISLNAKSKPGVSVIATRMPFDRLFRQLSSCIEVVLPDGDSMFFAFWDPAILGTLMGQVDDQTLHVRGPVLNSSQRLMLTQHMAWWWYWDRSGEMHALAHVEDGDAAPATRLTLTQSQVDDLVEASVPDHVLYYLELNQPFLIAEVPSSSRYQFVRQSLSKARGIGLLGMGDLVNYVCVEMIYKERMREPGIADLLQQVNDGRIAFREALEALP